MEALQKQETLPGELIASLVLKGDMSGLSQDQQVAYYRSMCERLGLDPATQPFKILNLSGKKVLYCDRSGAQQLNRQYHVSHAITSRERVEDVFLVYARASLPDGRFTESSGAVPLGNLRGEMLANAMMKCETKAKRRATLDLLGLGMLDETEIETIPHAEVLPAPEPLKLVPAQESAQAPMPHPPGRAGDYIVPIGTPKGKPIRELTDKQLDAAITYCMGKDKYSEFLSNLIAFKANPTEMTL